MTVSPQTVAAKPGVASAAPVAGRTENDNLARLNDAVGAVGEIHPDALDAYGISERVAVLELNLSVLLANEPKVPQWKATSRFPSADFDLAFSVPDTVSAEKLEKAIRQNGGGNLASVALFDVYRGVGVAEGARSLAFRLSPQSHERTLTDADVAEVRDKIIAAATKLGATLR